MTVEIPVVAAKSATYAHNCVVYKLHVDMIWNTAPDADVTTHEVTLLVEDGAFAPEFPSEQSYSLETTLPDNLVTDRLRGHVHMAVQCFEASFGDAITVTHVFAVPLERPEYLFII